MSLGSLDFVFKVLGPLPGATIVDVGSRLGPVLYTVSLRSRKLI